MLGVGTSTAPKKSKYIHSNTQKTTSNLLSGGNTGLMTFRARRVKGTKVKQSLKPRKVIIECENLWSSVTLTNGNPTNKGKRALLKRRAMNSTRSLGQVRIDSHRESLMGLDYVLAVATVRSVLDKIVANNQPCQQNNCPIGLVGQQIQ